MKDLNRTIVYNLVESTVRRIMKEVLQPQVTITDETGVVDQDYLLYMYKMSNDTYTKVSVYEFYMTIDILDLDEKLIHRIEYEGEELNEMIYV